MTAQHRYVLVGDDILVTYQPDDADGRETLLVRGRLPVPGGTIDLNFSASPIPQQTEIGNLLTVTVESSPDFGTRTLTLLLPGVNIEGFDSGSAGPAGGSTSWAAFDTQLIDTWHPETIAGAPHGALQHYRFLPLVGAAHSGKTLSCGDWSALYGSEPPDPPLLFVQGECRLPRAGFEATLRPHHSQPAGEGRLLLDLILTEPPGPTPEVETVVPVQFRSSAPAQPRAVVILPQGEEVAVGVMG